MSTVTYTMLATTSRPQSPNLDSTPTQASMSDEQMDLVDILRSGEDSRLRRLRPEPRHELPVVLYCGADQEPQAADWDEHRPWVVEMLPETVSLPARKRQKRSNGCGSRIHASAVPDRRWRGMREGASLDIVGLQDDYFTQEMKRELLLGRERCGCSRTGVGCAICGNPLGALFAPCSRHTPSSSISNFSTPHYTFLRATVSPPLPVPNRRVSLPVDETLFDRTTNRESLRRRIRDQEELQQLRARVRAAQARPPPPPRPSAADSVTTTEEAIRLLTAANATRRAERERDRERQQRSQEYLAALRMPILEPVDDDGRAAFEAWADATLQRATATAASDVPVVVDLSTLVDVRAPTAPPTTAPAPPPTTVASTAPPPRELSEEERRRDWQRGLVNAASRTLGRDRDRDFFSFGRTIERVTALPAPPGVMNTGTLHEALRRHYSEAGTVEPGSTFSGGWMPTTTAGATASVMQPQLQSLVVGGEQDKEDGTPRPRTRTFFER
ncbi:hypothetical protein B0H16DRAFT_1513724 [Mycena metata]|uniref:Uncharacterized protein n=1 Tax=Mycena metata TaxID=1033252 RepID=A0AAD7NR07_9AGAR|nr:hypothetical protein B0H16DRAFT_1513724 [Mycena metata]